MDERTRISRQLRILTEEQQRRIHDATILVIGAGGLGCPALQSLAAAGVGHIVLADDDRVDPTNLHRQILFGASDIGAPKVEVARRRLLEIQPGIEITPLATRLTATTMPNALSGVDLVVDGSDTFATKYLAADACEIARVPLVWGTVLRFSGQLALWDEGISLRDLFPAEPDPGFAPDCKTAGVLGATTAVIGNLMATEAIKRVAGLPTTPGRVLSYDALSSSFTTFRVRRDPDRDTAETLRSDAEELREHLLSALEQGRAAAIDVRDAEEKRARDLSTPGVLLRHPITESAVREALENVPDEAETIVVYCASGNRSHAFVDRFRALDPRLRSLPGGIGS